MPIYVWLLVKLESIYMRKSWVKLVVKLFTVDGKFKVLNTALGSSLNQTVHILGCFTMVSSWFIHAINSLFISIKFKVLNTFHNTYYENYLIKYNLVVRRI